MKWYVVIETAPDGKDYVGINDESYCGDGKIVSLHDSDDEAEAACIKYAQEQGLPLFAEYRDQLSPVMACPQCGNRDMDSLVMDDDDRCTCDKCRRMYDPQEGGETE